MFRNTREIVEKRSAIAAALPVTYPDNLPISAHAAAIRELWKTHPLIIVGGATGSGKTTQLPKIALELGCGRRGRIGCTQPRRLAATAMARRLAYELQTEYGGPVGYQVRFDDRTREETVLKFMTDGILLAETREDRLLKQYDALIIDEAHERGLNVDFLLGYLKNLLPQRPDLRVAISSATLDGARFSEFFDHAPVVRVEGRTFPVEDVFLPPAADEELSDHVARAVEFLSELDGKGDILVFLPGEREIREAMDLVSGRRFRNTEVLPLYARLSYADQQRVFAPGRMRRVILSTNVAETSLTIPGVRYCIDSGLARVKRYNPRSRIEELQIEMISQAAARQRRGRCGRTADGVCVHLYSEEDLKNAAPYTDPEIKRTGLAGVILQMGALHLPPIEHFPFLDPPSPPLIREGRKTLQDLRAIDAAGRLTPDGWQLAAMPVDPHIGRMLLEAKKRKVLPEMLVLAAGLSIPDVRERPAEAQQAADEAHRRWRDTDSDFIAMLNLWNELSSSGAFSSNGNLRRFCRKNFLNFNRVREWKNLVSDLGENTLHAPKPGVIDPIAADPLHVSLLAGIPRHIAQYDPENRQYRGTDGKKFYIFPGSGLVKRKKPPEWLLAFALVETSRVFARQAAEIRPEFLEQAAPHLCSRVYDQAHFDPASGFVRARERLTFGGLLIHAGRRVDFARQNPAAAREIFIREGLLTGAVSLPRSWVEDFLLLREEMLTWEQKLRRPGGVYDEEGCCAYFLRELPLEASSIEALKKLCREKRTFLPPREEVMAEQSPEFDPRNYPDSLSFGGISFPVEYVFAPGEEQDGCTLFVPEKQLNLLPEWALDYPPSGYWPDLTELLLRGLPREIRRTLSIPETVQDFVAGCRSGAILTERPLAEALADYLAENCAVRVHPDLFREMKRPGYLQLKLGILDERRRLKARVRELPDRTRIGSRLSGALPGVAKYTSSGAAVWPGVTALPETLEVPPGSGRLAYPALVDEGETVGSQIYLKKADALLHHAAGVLRLFQRDNAQLVKYVKRKAAFTNEMRMSWLLADRERRYEEDFMLAALEHAFGTELWLIRSREIYQQSAEYAAGHFVESGEALMEELTRLYGLYEGVSGVLRRIGSRSPEGEAELRRRVELLFHPGFLRRKAVWKEYRRYLRGLQLRAGRMLDNPARDAAKGEILEEWDEKLAAARIKFPEPSENGGLCDFWQLLEEAHLAVYAPEIPLGIRSPLNKLAPAWEELRL